jgi:protein-tyrosine phosphatase
MSKNLLVFVCTGNICRSPMAEYLARHRLKGNPNWDVQSAGLAAGAGSPASRPGIEAMQDFGIDMSAHRSQPLTQALIDEAKLLVVMTAAHRNAIVSHDPTAADKVYLLKSFGSSTPGSDVFDPIGMSLPVYREIRDEIDEGVEGLIARLAEYENE